MEVGLLDGWVRYWFRGELLPLLAALQRELTETRRQLQEERRRADEQAQRSEQETRRAEQERQARLALEDELRKARSEIEHLRNQQNRTNSPESRVTPGEDEG